jgi:Protein of unknown function (DUF2970).
MKQWIRAVASVFAAFLGVQSEANRRRDFTQGRFFCFCCGGYCIDGHVFIDRVRSNAVGVDGSGVKFAIFCGEPLQNGR